MWFAAKQSRVAGRSAVRRPRIARWSRGARWPGVARWRWLGSYVRGQVPALCVVLMLALLASGASIALPYLSKLIIDHGLIARDFPRLIELCAAVVALAGASFVVGAISRWIYVRASGEILFALREDVYGHLLALPPGFYRHRATGDLVTRLDGDVAEIQRFSTDTLLAFVNGSLLLIGAAVIMVSMSWQLAIVAAAVLPLQLAIRRWSRPLIASRTRALREQASAVAQFLFETLSAVKAIQGAVAEQRERERLHGLNRGYLSRLLSAQLVTYSVGGVSSLLSHAGTAAVFVYGGYRVIEGSLTVGTLVAFVAYMARGTGSAVSLLNLYTAYQRASVSLERVEELLAVERADSGRASRPDAGRSSRGDSAGGSSRVSIRGGVGHAAARSSGDAPTHVPKRASREATGELTLRAVSLGLKACGSPLLTDCNLEIPAGCKVVLYGASGVGKSTLIDACRRFAPLDSGRILLDGRDIQDYGLPVLRRSVEVLGSEPVIFRGTLLENLRYGSFDASEDCVLEAARLAGIDEIVASLPEGYASLVGSGGQGLSTGQRQRIAVARALLRRPSIIVLDEALANLDAAAAEVLQGVIDDQFDRCTRIVVTHHAPTRVPHADLILEMRAGVLAPQLAQHA